MQKTIPTRRDIQEQKLRRTLLYIKAFVLSNGYAPTGAEIARAFEVSAVVIYRRLLTLEERGLIKRGKGLRNLVVV